MVGFKPYPKLDSIGRYISYWIPEDDITVDQNSSLFKWNTTNEFYEMVREVCADNIGSVTPYDEFYHKKKLKYSHTFLLEFYSKY